MTIHRVALGQDHCPSDHIVLSGVYLGALVFHVELAPRLSWFLATLLSGLLLIFLDL